MQGSLKMFLKKVVIAKLKLANDSKTFINFKRKIELFFSVNNTAQYEWIRNTLVETAVDFILRLTEKEERVAVSINRRLMIKYKKLSLGAFLSKKKICRYLKKPLYCNFPSHIYLN